MRQRAISSGLGLTVLLSGALLAQTGAAPKESPNDLVICVVCGDYEFPRKDSVPATFEGEKISLCSANELDLIKQDPDKYVWAIDPVSGARVNKIHTRFTVDRPVQVKKKDGRIETWPRSFFFESATTRDQFLKRPERYLKEPYPV